MDVAHNDCSICLFPCDSTLDDVFTNTCNHTFHKKCINCWNHSSNVNCNTCPLCRANLVLDNTIGITTPYVTSYNDILNLPDIRIMGNVAILDMNSSTCIDTLRNFIALRTCNTSGQHSDIINNITTFDFVVQDVKYSLLFNLDNVNFLINKCLAMGSYLNESFRKNIMIKFLDDRQKQNMSLLTSLLIKLCDDTSGAIDVGDNVGVNMKACERPRMGTYSDDSTLLTSTHGISNIIFNVKLFKIKDHDRIFCRYTINQMYILSSFDKTHSMKKYRDDLFDA
jgi:hypothetical protein